MLFRSFWFPLPKETSDTMQFRAIVLTALVASASSLGMKKRLSLDDNQQVWIENQPVLGAGVGPGALNTCRAIAPQHVSNPAAPVVKVCGGGIFATFFLRGACENYYTHQVKIGQCGSAACQTFSPADSQEFGGYQSYKIEQCPAR